MAYSRHFEKSLDRHNSSTF